MASSLCYPNDSAFLLNLMHGLLKVKSNADLIEQYLHDAMHMRARRIGKYGGGQEDELKDGQKISLELGVGKCLGDSGYWSVVKVERNWKDCIRVGGLWGDSVVLYPGTVTVYCDWTMRMLMSRGWSLAGNPRTRNSGYSLYPPVKS